MNQADWDQYGSGPDQIRSVTIGTKVIRADLAAWAVKRKPDRAQSIAKQKHKSKRPM